MLKPFKAHQPLKPLIARKKPKSTSAGATVTSGKSGSHVEAIKYDDETKSLIITFRGGRQYQYSDVPKDLADGLHQSPSKGSFIHSYIKNKFTHKTID